MKKKGILAFLLATFVACLLTGVVACSTDNGENKLYTVSYAAGAADATGEVPASESYAKGSTVTLKPSTVFEREGYVFAAWSDGSSSYEAGASYVMPAKNVTFTALWTLEGGQEMEMEQVSSIPTSDLTTVQGEATVNWFAEYGDDAFVVTAWVADTRPYFGSTIYRNDSVEVLFARAERVRSYNENTISVLADIAGNIRVTLPATGEEKAETNITADSAIVTLDGTTAAGFRIAITVPYAEVEFTKADKDAALALCFNNAANAGGTTAAYADAFGTDFTRVHTFIAVTANDTFAVNPYFNYSANWGDGGTLRASDSWNLDDDTEKNGEIFMTSDDGNDNYIYLFNSNVNRAYVEAEISVSRAFPLESGRYDEYPKFGLTLSNAAGTKRFFFFVDARADALTGDILSGSVNLGTAAQYAGIWDWTTETKAGDFSGSSAAYYPNGYLKLGMYREGDTVSLYANGVKKKTMKLPFEENEIVYFGLASFHLQLGVRNYRLETENFEGFDTAAQKLDYLFLGASTLTDSSNYWYSYSTQFAGLNAINLSVPGYQVENWVNQLDDLQAMYTPAKIVMHIGMNNINNAGESAETVIGRLQQLFGGLNDRYPEAQLYYISITRNVNYSGNDSKYIAVNNWAKTTAANEYGVTFIDVDGKFARPNGRASMQWFVSDGYHLSSDGYGIYHREIVKALGIPYEESVSGLGDTNVSGAPDYGHTGDWQVEGNVWHGYYGRESRLMINGAYGSTIYAEAKISVVDVNGSYEKAGIAVSSPSGTYFLYINLALELINNANREWRDNYGALCFRPENHNAKDWLYPEAPGYYRPLGSSNGYVELGGEAYDWKSDHNAYKTLGVAKVGTKLYFFAGGNRIGLPVDTVFGANEAVTVSVFAFNTDLYAKGGSVKTNAAEVRAMLPELAASAQSAKTPVEVNVALPTKKD